MLKAFKELFGEHYVSHGVMYKTGAGMVAGATALNQVITGFQFNWQAKAIQSAGETSNKAVRQEVADLRQEVADLRQEVADQFGVVMGKLDAVLEEKRKP